MRSLCLLAAGLALSLPSTLAHTTSRFAGSFPRHRVMQRYADSGPNTTVGSSQQLTGTSLDATLAPTTTAPHANIWASLTQSEVDQVYAFLLNSTDLNLTNAADAGPFDNRVFVVETLPPNKTDAMAYMAGGPVPDRYARASLFFGHADPAYTMDYAIKLPVTSNTTLTSLDWWANKGTTYTINYQADAGAITDFALAEMSNYDDILASVFNITTQDMGIYYNEPIVFPNGTTIWWFWTWYPTASEYVDSQTLLPTGFYYELKVAGRDNSTWTPMGWFYNKVYYPSGSAFRAAYAAGQLATLPYNADGAWTNTDQTGQTFAYDSRSAPVLLAAQGKRYAVDEANRYVEWDAFSFYMGFSHDTGLSLYDIRYDNTTILFELGLQEALAHYAGQDPTQSLTCYLDTAYGIGPDAYQMVAGYDCPHDAYFFNASTYFSEVTVTNTNAICLFEMVMPTPMQRHTAGQYASVTKQVALVLKTVSTVGNYDYTFTYMFRTDGSIEIVVEASGYIQATFYANNQDYGYHIHDALSGSMHDHVLTYKADFDVAGTANTLAVHSLVPVSTTYPWSHGILQNTMKLDRALITTETGLDWPYNAGSMAIVQNLNVTNKYGEPVGWRIRPSGGTSHLTVINSTRALNSAHFSEHDMFVTKHKDTESRVSHVNNWLDRDKVIVDFGKFLDGESIQQEDIVVWFNLGMHHVPHTGDLPNTVMSSARSSVMLTPHNYLLSDPSRRSQQMVRLNFNATQSLLVDEFGQSEPSYSYSLGSAYPSYTDYFGSPSLDGEIPEAQLPLETN